MMTQKAQSCKVDIEIAIKQQEKDTSGVPKHITLIGQHNQLRSQHTQIFETKTPMWPQYATSESLSERCHVLSKRCLQKRSSRLSLENGSMLALFPEALLFNYRKRIGFRLGY